MTTNHHPSLVGRFVRLLRGAFGAWIRDRESGSPRAVYEQAIQERAEQYAELKSAVAGILYMRNKLDAEIQERRVELARSQEDVQRSIQKGADEVALTLIVHKQDLCDELSRSERELEGLRSDAEEAKTNLVRFREELRSLVREKGRALAVLASSRARQRMNSAIEGLSVDADVQALENIREHIAQVATEGSLEQELEGQPGGLRARIRSIREEARADGARKELEELKRQLEPTLPARREPVFPATSAPLD